MVVRYLGGINNPSYNPLAANVTTGVTTVQQGGIYTSSSASQNIPTGRWLDDPFFNQTTLLLQADNAVNGAQNNTFLDSSTNNFTVTRNGNPTQGSFSPFSEPNGYWSNFFDGNADYFNVIGSSNLAFGTNNFTIEAWVYLTAASNGQIFYDGRASGVAVGNYALLYTPASTSKFAFYVNGADRISSNNTVIQNQWYHVAISRVSGTTRMFVNGVLQTQTWADTTTYLNGANRPAVGVYGDVQTAGYMTGYISNLRALNGTGLYTTSFTPPTEPLTAIANTQLLTCQSNRLVDNSANAYAITKNGDAATRPFSPLNNNVPQFNGPTGVGSVFSRGFDNYALITQSLIPRDQRTFTIEAWVYITVNDQQLYPELICDDAFGDFNWNFGIRNSRRISFMWRTGVGVYQEARGLTSLPFNTWQHIAISVTNDEIWLYLNGVADLSSPNSLSNRLQVDNRTVIGGIAGTSNSFFYQGLVSNLSVLNGVGKYPNGTTFAVPTAPLPVDAAGQVLLFARPSAVDSNVTVAPKTITITGSMPNNISSPFGSVVTFPNAGGSAYFDGTGDYLTLTGSSNLAFGSNDFTIECFFYLTALPAANQVIYDGRASGGTATLAPALYIAQTTNVLSYFTNNAVRITGATALTTGQWHHVVVSRVSGTTRMFLNGAQQGSNYTDANVYINGASRPVIAAAGDNIGLGPVNGYISSLRVVNGTGVTSVTVPTAPLVPIVNTQLLLSATNAGISDATRLTAFETVGNAQVSTTIKKYGSGSMFFDGTGDWLLAPNNPDINFGTGDFTVECWLNISNTTTTRHLIGKGTATTGWAIYFNAQPTLLIFEYGGSITYSSNYNLITDQWYHIAVVRSGTGIGNIKMFINGFLIFESGVAINTDLTTLQPLYVGASRTGTNSMFGYIDDLRITKGVARYTSTFTPPTVALPRQG